MKTQTSSHPTRARSYRSFKSHVNAIVRDRFTHYKKGSTEPAELRAQQAKLLENLVDIEQADKEMFEWFKKHNTFAEFLDTRAWMRETRWKKRKAQALLRARAIVRENKLTPEDLI